MRRAYRSFQFLFKRVRRTAVARLGANLLGDRRGAVAMYAAFVGALLIGGSVLVIDVGRVMVLRAEMQDAADSAALSAVVYLDRSPGAIARATAMAQNGVRHASGVPEGSGNITVATITFFSSYNVGGAMPRGTPAAGLLPTDDAIAAYIEVRLQPETMSMLLQPVLAIFGSGGPGTKTYTTYAVAENSGGAGCGIPPIMVCNPTETGGPSLTDPANIGRQMVIKEGPGKGLLAPGEFGLLCVNGACGSPVINNNLSSPSASNCVSGDGTVQTAPGGKTNQVKWGLNARLDIFGKGSSTNELNPAPNVYDYPPDDNMASVSTGNLGNGNWDVNDYWYNLSDHVGALPLALSALGVPPGNPTRYQVYLYEIGANFYAKGNRTAYPTSSLADATGWTPVNGATDIPACPVGAVNCREGAPIEIFDGMDGAVNICLPGLVGDECEYLRRTITVAVLNCVDLGVQGNATYDAAGFYVSFFVTEDVEAAPAATIYAELVAPALSATGPKSPAIKNNVRLIE